MRAEKNWGALSGKFWLSDVRGRGFDLFQMTLSSRDGFCLAGNCGPKGGRTVAPDEAYVPSRDEEQRRE